MFNYMASAMKFIAKIKVRLRGGVQGHVKDVTREPLPCELSSWRKPLPEDLLRWKDLPPVVNIFKLTTCYSTCSAKGCPHGITLTAVASYSLNDMEVLDEHEELCKAVYGQGKYRLSNEYAFLAKTPAQWTQMTLAERRSHLVVCGLNNH